MNHSDSDITARHVTEDTAAAGDGERHERPHWAYYSEGLGLDQLIRRTPARRALRASEVRVKVAAAAINYRDVALARGEYLSAMPRPFIPLSEGAGRVEEVAADVVDLAPGDAVLGHYTSAWIAGGFKTSFHASKIGGPLDGWLAEEIILPREALLGVPPGWSLEEAASLAISGVTAWKALMGDASDQALHTALTGRYVLIEGTGNVSLQALTLAASADARPVVLTSRPQFGDELRRLGAHAVIGPGSLDQRRQAILDATEGRGLDLAVDVVGGDTLISLLLPLMAVRGRVAVVGFLDGGHVHGDLVGPMLRGLLRLEGVSVGSRSDFEALLAHMQRHDLRPRIAARFAPERIRDALTHRPESLGKTVVVMDTELASSRV
ncbi:zinc-dependent alcohol dehydrogenase family protein [Halomonas sp. V046]|uniref:zinc-dependent alcohol dehydrogenase family protein n=1 Tax=Halomonas sp. V046 TaxID=3459611 RepID=UPI0040443416